MEEINDEMHGKGEILVILIRCIGQSTITYSTSLTFRREVSICQNVIRIVIFFCYLVVHHPIIERIVRN